MNPPKLTVLSFGGGQDSTAILYKYIYDETFREDYAPNDFVVVMSDTGDEHPETVKHVHYVQDLCRLHDVEFHYLTYDKGFHSPTYPGLREYYWMKNQVGSKAFTKTCTNRLKIVPIDNWLERYIEDRYLLPKIRNKSGKSYKRAYYTFHERYGKIQRIVGIAAGEESRVADNENRAWAKLSLKMCYPLIDLNMNRAACQEFIKSVGHEVPLPSNCMLCPWMNHVELLWLYRFYPEDYIEWVLIELNKMEHFSSDGANHGVWPGKTLPEVLAESIDKHGHMSDEELREYKMSHGHCVMSKY